jgi:predicted outer membrane repeat protein
MKIALTTQRAVSARWWLCVAIGLVWLYLFAAGQPVSAATFTVDTALDGVDSDLSDGECLNVTVVAGGACTLRAAIQQANANLDSDTINLPAGTYVLALENALDTAEDAAATGDLDITSNIIIAGEGAKATIIEAGEGLKDRLFQLHGEDAVIAINRVTIRNGDTTSLTGDTQDGGGILNNGGSLNLFEVVVSNNSSPTFGGGIAVYGSAFFHRCLIHDNAATGGFASRGGGVWAAADSLLTLANCTLSGNQADSRGGGLDISNNNGFVSIINTTVANNRLLASAEEGAGIYIGNNTEVHVTSSIFADNLAQGDVPNDCDGQFDLLDFSLVEAQSANCMVAGDGENNSSILGSDALLGALADNGGNLLTHALLRGSVAIDAGSQLVPGVGGRACYATDARGVRRPVGLYCDMGSFEARLDAYLPTLSK